MAKKTKAAAGPSIMEQLAAYQPPWEGGESKQEVKSDAKADETASLMARLAAAEKALEDNRKQQLLQTYQTQPQAPTVQAAKKSTEVNMDGLPDPVTDPKVYTAELIKRINTANEARLENSRAEMAAQQSSSQLAQQVWDGFKAAHSDWAKHDLLVQAAANKVAGDLAGRGVDIQKMMRSSPELFYGEVVGMLDKQYPQLKAQKEEGEEKDDGEEANRTAGVFGGNAGGRQAAPRGEVQAEPEGSMLRDLAEMRYKAGVR